jgi:U3 small nucleolar RNA-associated protein 25
MDLMRSLVESAPAPPKAKRRKLDHPVSDAVIGEGSSPKPQESRDEDDSEEDDEDQDIDQVEEEEAEGSQGDDSPEDLFDNDDEADVADPFEVHFSKPDEKAFMRKIKAIEGGPWNLNKVTSKSNRLFINAPKTPDETGPGLPAAVSGPSDLKLKKKLRDVVQSKSVSFRNTEQLLAPFIFNYHDTLFCDRTLHKADSIRQLAALHALNHIFKTRDRVIKDNERLARADGDDDLELRDQGFTRPKVLMILPTRQSCAKMVDMITSLCEPGQQENRKRFEDSYVDKVSKFSDDKPADFRDLFGGNDDDNFRMGMKFTRKSIKYFAQFYNSDIIFASPLGLRMAIGSEEEKGAKVDFDYLSSIELVIVDQADALLMQNWEHLEFIFEHLNVQPKDAHGCDFSRVRNWYLEDQAKYFRQTIIFSAFNTPELAELFRAHCHNWAGKVRIQPEYPGMIQQILGVKARQTFSRFESPSIQGDPDARFAYFTKAIVPTLTKRAKDAAGTLIFIPSYLDFVRVRNYFANNSAVETLSFGTISEYADVPEASRARSYFLNGRQRLLLYTERAHHFRRYQIRGVKRIIMYGLPDNPLFYQEIVGGYLQSSEQAFLLEHGQGSVRVMFSKYDVFKLERIVGTQRVGKMIHERGDTFDFV